MRKLTSSSLHHPPGNNRQEITTISMAPIITDITMPGRSAAQAEGLNSPIRKAAMITRACCRAAENIDRRATPW